MAASWGTSWGTSWATSWGTAGGVTPVYGDPKFTRTVFAGARRVGTTPDGDGSVRIGDEPVGDGSHRIGSTLQ